MGKYLMYYESQMRRLVSISLVLFFSLGPLAATLEASDDARLPACCRRHGTHHCAMTARVAAMMTESTDARTTAPHALTAAAVGLPALIAQTHAPAAARAAARVSQIRTRSGRAPPASFLA
jgi:hypothetical protein